MPFAEAFAGFVALIIIGVLTSAIRPEGRLRRAIKAARSRRKRANGANEAIPEISEKLDCLDGKQDQTLRKLDKVEQKVEDVGTAVFYLHADDDNVNDTGTLAERLGVDPPDDFMRGAQGDD